MSKRIGILTGGGDCPGLNAVIRAVTKTALIEYGYSVIGFEDGYDGLVLNRSLELNYERASGILAAGGTILGTSNKANPFEYWRKDPQGNYYATDESATALRTYQQNKLDALVVVGGDGSFTIASKLSKLGMHVVGVPKTIDNDIYGTDQTFGFDTAVNIITDAIDRIHTTAMSHHRAMVIEVMGRNAGWLALHAGIAGGGDIILLPELPYDINVVCERVQARSQRGRRFSIIVVAEGARPQHGQQVVDRVVKDSPDPVRLGGIGKALAAQIEDSTATETRVTVLGHLQRGGPPSPHDRVLCTQLGKRAVDLIAEGQFGQFVCVNEGKLGTRPLDYAAGRQRLVPPDHPLIATARAVGTSFGV